VVKKVPLSVCGRARMPDLDVAGRTVGGPGGAVVRAG
jgi:hypothetical protein